MILPYYTLSARFYCLREVNEQQGNPFKVIENCLPQTFTADEYFGAYKKAYPQLTVDSELKDVMRMALELGHINPVTDGSPQHIQVAAMKRRIEYLEWQADEILLR